MKGIAIDRNKHLREQPHTGHNRWHPDIEPALEIEPGEDVVLETRDSGDGFCLPESTITDMVSGASTATGVLHPLTGPVYVKGAQPGDLLEVEFLQIQAEPWGFTCIFPGLGFLRDLIATPFLAHWKIEEGWATSPQIPGVRIPGAPFMGIAGVAPSRQQLKTWTEREADLLARGGFAMPPDPNEAVPANHPAASSGLRTLAPRENGGNMDIKQLSKGAKLFLPVAVEGALFSTGDAHFAQGDGEVCVAAAEMGASCVVRFRVHSGEATRRNIRWPRFQRNDYFIEPKWAAPQRFIATVGMPVDEAGTNHGENLNVACRNALLDMIDLLGERGFSREQAYIICSVAMDFKVSNVVDAPNFVVSAFLPEDVFDA